MESQELRDRLSLIENMIAEGRRGTESWGWSFVLWGVAYLVALGWSGSSFHSHLSWPVTMLAAAAAVWVKVAMDHRRAGTENPPSTTIGRAVTAIWIAMGISLFFLLLLLGSTHRFDTHVFTAIVCCMLGLANAASSMILRWGAQAGCALIWWASAACAAFGSDAQTLAAFIAAIVICQIGFGAYCMVLETRERRLAGGVHA